MKQWRIRKSHNRAFSCWPSSLFWLSICLEKLGSGSYSTEYGKIEHVGQSQYFQKSKLGQADQLLASHCQEWWVHMFLLVIVMLLFEFRVTCGRKRYAASMQCWCKLHIRSSACCSLMSISSSAEVYSTCAYSRRGPAFLANTERSEEKQVLSVILTYTDEQLVISTCCPFSKMRSSLVCWCIKIRFHVSLVQ